ncbi:MAG: cytochrome c3 family protein, partial [Planctomycetota bacterium]
QTCGQCHSVFDFFDDQDKAEFNQTGFTFRPGDNLRDSRHIFQMGKDEEALIVQRTLKRNPKFYERQFWSDGMVRVSGREYNGLLETACYQHGTMSCLSCHEMHPGSSDPNSLSGWADDQLKPGMRGNESCLQCHDEYRSEAELVGHTHHAATSTGSNCYNCHMPHTTLGLMKAMRSHTVDSPDVAATLATGRPNACNLCHLDQTLAWTSSRLSEWYDIPAPALSKEESQIASSVRWILRGDAGQRAIAGWHYGWEPAQQASGTDWMAPYLAELLADDYDVVRFIGYHSLTDMPGYSGFEYDFVGSVESRQKGKLQAETIWENWLPRPEPNGSLLIDSQGSLLENAFDRMRKERSNKRVILIE